jgi:peptidoglycan-associated lipoprotein
MKKFTLFFTIVLAACSSVPKTAPAPTPQPEAKQEAPAPEVKMAGPSQAEIDAKKLADELQLLKDKSVYFDFDKSFIKPEFHDTVQQQAEFIKSHGNDVVTLEGNCDERGSEEYNLALGERRASAVRKMLEALGVPEGQMKTVSYGEDRPRLTCHEERCWKENRRVDFDHKLHQ